MIVRHAGGARLKRTLSSLAMAGALVLALGALTPGALAAARSQNDSSNITLDIVQPAAPNGFAEGPVGANIAVTGTAPTGDTLQLGVAKRADGCTTGFQSLGNVSVTVGSSGSFTQSFQWPSIASSVGERYYVCAKDTTTNAIGTSTTQYQVDSSDAPTITSVQPVNDPNATSPGAGTPAPTQPNLPEGQVYAGGFVEIKGTNFTPGGTPLLVLLTLQQLTPATASQPPLQVVKGQTVTRHDGSFDLFAQIPNETGSFFLSVTSNDGTTQVLPSLVGTATVQVVKQPTATVAPTPSPTVHATVVPTSTPPGKNPSNGPGTGKIVGAIAMGLFSALFFIVGVAMLISASGMSGPGEPGMGNGPGSAPGRPQPRY